MRLQRAPDALHRGRLDRQHAQHRVRIAHRHGADLERLAGGLQRVGCGCGRRLEGQGARREVRHAHVDADAPGREHAGLDHPGRAVHAQRPAARPAAPPQEFGDAARPVAALLDLAAVGIEDAVVDRGARPGRRLQHQRLVEADAGVAVGQPSPGGGVGQGRRVRRIHDDEVVAESVHLGEVEAHAERKHTAACGASPPTAHGAVDALVQPRGHRPLADLPAG